MDRLHDPCLITCSSLSVTRIYKPSIQHYIHHIWQETWDQQVINKLHSIHSSTAHWAAVPVRRHDFPLTLLSIGHTRLNALTFAARRESPYMRLLSL
ncbi:hypothetical protein TNCV_1873711 [Trichonephila clavipes]|nr:hypothetical protein TNCV_1873711 [Trichonephila clavipes]